ncbi:hypothetical protein M422DRAFT_265073 [Sphaerobolus stellatus SS14]|uniref:Uncharacterized protein n=1 Tax=Sphaerobolus stellatus (strain SS14) TaxID=990650 RepID=A0A0C9TS35_SPHS4|nr:hypothetical protein M422DRAFT_265073 [Sphaerobolus stellatus SS14]
MRKRRGRAGRHANPISKGSLGPSTRPTPGRRIIPLPILLKSIEQIAFIFLSVQYFIFWR